MLTPAFTTFVTETLEYLHSKHPNRDLEKDVFAQCVKLNEEVGEAMNEVLGYFALQREEKNEEYSLENIGHELADVMIVCMIIAERLGIDMNEHLTQKVTTLIARRTSS